MRVVVMTSHHVYTGEIEAGEQRLSEALSNILLSALRMRDVSVARLADPGTVLSQHREVQLPGREIVAGFEVEAPRPVRADRVVRKHAHRVSLIAERLEVTGNVHALSETSLDIKEMLTTHADRFLPVTDAEVLIAVERGHRVKLGAVLINARRLHSVAPIA